MAERTDVNLDVKPDEKSGAEAVADRRARAEARVGQTLDGRWELEGLCGLGGMACVYRARGPAGGTAAIKLLDEREPGDEQQRERFFREARLMSRVDHPGAVHLVETGVTEAGRPFYAMELLEGWEISRLLKRRRGPFPIATALKLACHTLDVLESYHRAGVLHLDIKPGNLFMARRGRIKLIDFGLARERTSGVRGVEWGPGERAGTPAYMAPEQAVADDALIGPETDVFAVGATLFEMLTGSPIREVGEGDDGFVLAARGSTPMVGELAPELPEPVRAVVDRALARKPADRWASAAAMRDAVDAALQELQGAGAGRSTGPLETMEPERAGGERTIAADGSGGANRKDRQVARRELQERWVDDGRLAQMRSTHKRDNGRWLKRSALMVAHLWNASLQREEADRMEDLIRKVAERLADAHRWARLVEWLGGIQQRVDDEFERRELTGAVLEPGLLWRLLDNLGDEEVAQRPDPETFREVLRWLPEERFRTALRGFLAAPPPVRQALVPYLLAHVQGLEDVVGGALEAAEGPAAVDAVKLLASSDTERAGELLRRTLDHPDEAVRREAAERLGKRVAAGARGSLGDEISEMITADKPRLRIQGLELAKVCQSNKVASELARRASSESFDQLPASERRRVLETLADISPPRAEKVAIELVRRHGFFADEAHTTTRILAMGVLAEVGSRREAVEALEEARRLRLWNPREVRDCAEASVQKLRQRDNSARE